MQLYRSRCGMLGIPQDEALAALLAFLVLYLEPVQKKLRARREFMRTVAKWTVSTGLASAAVASGLQFISSSHGIGSRRRGN
jgi:hypothetical protein